MMIWIDLQLILAIHDRQIAEHGGGAGIRDAGLLESALAHPIHLASLGDPPPDLAQLAASLIFGLSRNHPFIDGNKRTSAVAGEVFIVLNGGQLRAEDAEVYAIFVALAAGDLDENGLAEWLRSRISLASDVRVQQPVEEYG
ncbi:type II toxin-antitoxin system death-on-curing family toxin [Aquilutibacter rugosus]|jgi:death-on-curing protein|uniref:type II toxin-antitoxin system death-on-curing family toxin n=1 Tax=Aquilutibacter rugosus TaxID=3115820 RepID=UPI002F42CA2A